MVWEVVWSKKSVEQLKKLDKKIAIKIRNLVLDIRQEPYREVRRLTNSHLYALRMGDYRVILDLRRGKLIIFVISLSKRGRVYDRL